MIVCENYKGWLLWALLSGDSEPDNAEPHCQGEEIQQVMTVVNFETSAIPSLSATSLVMSAVMSDQSQILNKLLLWNFV